MVDATGIAKSAIATDAKVKLVAIIVGVSLLAIVGYEVYKAVKGFSFGWPKLPALTWPKLPALTLPKLPALTLPSPSGSAPASNSPTFASANTAFQNSVAPYLISSPGMATSLSHFQQYASYKQQPLPAILQKPQTPANYQAQVYAQARRARVQMVQSSAGDVWFSGTQAQGYGQVLSGKKYILFNKSQEG